MMMTPLDPAEFTARLDLVTAVVTVFHGWTPAPRDYPPDTNPPR